MKVNQLLTIELPFVISPIVVGMGIVRWLADNSDVLGVFGLFIAMTPLTLFFEYSVFVPPYFVFIGILLSVVGHVRLYNIRSLGRIKCISILVYSTGVSLTFVSLIVFILACLAFNVGQGPAPGGWVISAKISSVAGEIGFITVVSHWIMSKFAPARTRAAW